jgi:hypothetical protein
MHDYGHQHHHGVRKNIVEGVGGVIIGAATVLLVASLLRHRKGEADRSAGPSRPSERVAGAPAGDPTASTEN